MRTHVYVDAETIAIGKELPRKVNASVLFRFVMKMSQVKGERDLMRLVKSDPDMLEAMRFMWPKMRHAYDDEDFKRFVDEATK